MEKKLSYRWLLFVSVAFVTLTFIGFFIFFQYSREREFKAELMNVRLQDCNKEIYGEINDVADIHVLNSVIQTYASCHDLSALRLTVIRDDGRVLFDNQDTAFLKMENHLNRDEVQQALQNGSGFSINRISETLDRNYFYSATYFKQAHMVIRSSIPYDDGLSDALQVDRLFLYFALLVTLLIVFILFLFSKKMAAYVQQLRDFVEKAEKGEEYNSDLISEYPDKDLGEISKHLVNVYKNLKSTKEALITEKEEQARLKHQLTQNIAHELKTPVCSIQGFLETILDNDTMDEETKRQFLQRCLAQSNRLTNLLRDISVLTRLDEASQMMEMESVDIASVVQTIQKETALEIEKQNMHFVDLLPSSLILNGNASSIYSVFRNLTDNAIAYAGEGTTITIRCTGEDENFYYFSFADNGIGVGEEHLTRLFERFYRVDKGRSRKLGGTGLGLAIVKNAIIFHHGAISARNVPGGGLEFIFNLKKVIA